MMSKRFLMILVVCGGVLAACQPADDVLPTYAPTLPQSQDVNTPEPTAFIEPTAEPPTAAPIERPTLPPSWTPSPAPADTQQPLTSTPPPTVPPPPSPLAVCTAFGLDSQRNSLTFTLGTSPQVFWFPVEGAVSYRVSLINDLGEELAADYTADTTFTFPSDLFARDKRYGWQVYPMDILRQQMCVAVGAELIPQ